MAVLAALPPLLSRMTNSVLRSFCVTGRDEMPSTRASGGDSRPRRSISSLTRGGVPQARFRRPPACCAPAGELEVRWRGARRTGDSQRPERRRRHGYDDRSWPTRCGYSDRSAVSAAWRRRLIALPAQRSAPLQQATVSRLRRPAPPGLDPRLPLGKTLAGGRRHADHLQLRIDAARMLDRQVHIEIGWGSRSILFSASAMRRGTCPGFERLVLALGHRRIATLCASPRSKAAGQTRLPTFSMKDHRIVGGRQFPAPPGRPSPHRDGSPCRC